MAASDVAMSDATFLQDPRWSYLRNILTIPGPFTDPDWQPAMLSTAKVLVVGAGGLGCEILKNLALSGFKDIHVIDMDTIDVSNLNRQFLFRQADVGKPKAEVAARFVERRCGKAGVKITPFCGKIQDKDEEYYMQFDLVICGLDSIEARRWMNSTLVNMVNDNPGDPRAFKPLVDGGTEGFKGQARVVYPTMTSCIECQLDMHAPRAQVPLCTIATIPRQPQHCIEWAHQIAWDQERSGDVLDNDDPEHITWLFEKAAARAKEFNIEGVTYSMTQGVVKNIIPAIASTNAIIAAACCSEALKLLTACAPSLGTPETNNYMMYTGDDSVYTYTFEHQKKDDCPVCAPPRPLAVNPAQTLQVVLDKLAALEDTPFKAPSLSAGGKSLFYAQPESLFQATKANLGRLVLELIEDGDELAVTDPAYQNQFRFTVSFEEEGEE